MNLHINTKHSDLSRFERSLVDFCGLAVWQIRHSKHQDAVLDFLYFAAVPQTHVKGTASHWFHKVLFKYHVLDEWTYLCNDKLTRLLTSIPCRGTLDTDILNYAWLEHACSR